MKYLVSGPKYMKYPAVGLSNNCGVSLKNITTFQDGMLVQGNIDVVKAEQMGYIVEDYIEEKVIIKVTGSYAQIISPLNDFLEDIIDQACSYQLQDIKFMNLKWDGIVRFYRRKQRQFPVGLLYLVKEAVTEYFKGLGELIISDMRPEPVQLDCMPDRLQGIELREYQSFASDRGMEMGSGVLWLAVGSGKTEIACDLIRRWNTTAAFIVHRKELLYQAKERLEKRLGVEVGQIGAGVCQPRQITVMMVQCLSRYIQDDKFIHLPDDKMKLKEEDDTEITIPIKELLNKYHTVVFDEVYHLPARTFFKVATAFDAARNKYGLSADPFREDGAELAIFAGVGGIIHKLSPSELIRQGFLVPPKIKMIATKKMILHGDTYQEAYKKFIVENPDRNGRLVDEIEKLYFAGRYILVLVDRVAHGKWFEKELPKFGVSCSFVHGTLGDKKRALLLASFKSGDLRCLIATASLYQEGVDIPRANCLVNAGGGKAKSKIRQMIGRVLRIHPGKSEAVIIDVMDECHYLRKQSSVRLDVYREEKEFEVVVE